MPMTGTDKDRKHWSEVAREWIAWARKPNHDAFWAYRDSLVAFIGRNASRSLVVSGAENDLALCQAGARRYARVPGSAPCSPVFHRFVKCAAT
jgi:hypothetical protein